MNQMSSKNIFLEIKQVMLEARNNVASAVNAELLKAYWQTGRIIVEDEQNHQDRADYGKGLLKELSKLDLPHFLCGRCRVRCCDG